MYFDNLKTLTVVEHGWKRDAISLLLCTINVIQCFFCPLKYCFFFRHAHNSQLHSFRSNSHKTVKQSDSIENSGKHVYQNYCNLVRTRHVVLVDFYGDGRRCRNLTRKESPCFPYRFEISVHTQKHVSQLESPQLKVLFWQTYLNRNGDSWISKFLIDLYIVCWRSWYRLRFLCLLITIKHTSRTCQC